MSKARRIIENLFEGSAPVAPEPATKPMPKSPGPIKPTPGKTPKHDPWRRRDVKPGTAPKPKAYCEAKKPKGKAIAKSPGKVSYRKESLARRLLDA